MTKSEILIKIDEPDGNLIFDAADMFIFSYNGPIQSVYRAMDEYAKQQAIAFVKYNCPDIKFDDSLLNAGYAGFLIYQSEQQNKDNGNKGEG